MDRHEQSVVMVVTPVQKECREGEGVHLCHRGPGLAGQYCISSNLKCDGRVNCFARDLRTSGQRSGQGNILVQRSLINDAGKFWKYSRINFKIEKLPRCGTQAGLRPPRGFQLIN